MTVTKTKKLTFSAVCLALCLWLPMLTGHIQAIGNKISPMHIPVFLCGLLCGAPAGLIVGAIAPILRFFLFGMPPLLPTGVAMAFELAAYGAVSGFVYQKVNQKLQSIAGVYISLAIAMLAGRVVWGLASCVIYSIIGTKVFTMQMFLAGAFINAVPAIILHLVLIPPVVMALKKAGLFLNRASK